MRSLLNLPELPTLRIAFRAHPSVNEAISSPAGENVRAPSPPLIVTPTEVTATLDQRLSRFQEALDSRTQTLNEALSSRVMDIAKTLAEGGKEVVLNVQH